MNFIAAKCPACNGELQVPDDRDFVKCMYCGVDVKIREATKMKIDINIPNLLNLAKFSFEAKNYQEANSYYNKILESDISNFEAWFGKAETSGKVLANLKGLNSNEMIVCFENVVKYYSGDNLSEFKIKIANKIYNICNEYLTKLSSFKINLNRNLKGFNEYISHCKYIIELLEKGLEFDNNNVKLIKGIILICNDNIKMDGVYLSGAMGTNSYDRNIKVGLSPAHKNSLQEKINIYTEKLPLELRPEKQKTDIVQYGKLSKKSKIILAIAFVILILIIIIGIINDVNKKQKIKKTSYYERIY